VEIAAPRREQEHKAINWTTFAATKQKQCQQLQAVGYSIQATKMMSKLHLVIKLLTLISCARIKGDFGS
jgi:hypothetical protein